MTTLQTYFSRPAKKTLFAFIVYFAFQDTGYAQGVIKGVFSSKSKNSIANLPVMLIKGKDTLRTMTGGDGSFVFSVPANGHYRLYASANNGEDFTSDVRMTGAQDTLNIGNLRLHDVAERLQEVEVVGRERRDYNSDYSFSSQKIALDNMDVAQSVSTVTKELFADQQAFQMGDVYKNISGVSRANFDNVYAIRGVTMSAGNHETHFVNGMRTTAITTRQMLTANVERVEVLKGPSSMTFSNVDPGGTLNMITKKPLKERRHSVSFSAGSFKTLRGALDFTGPMNKSKTLLYRVNAAYEDAGSFRDLQFNKTLLLTPSFSFVPSDNTSVNVEIIYNHNNTRFDRGQAIIGATSGSGTNLHSTPISTSLSGLRDHYNLNELQVIASLHQKLAKGLSAIIKYAHDTWTADLFENRPNNSFATDSAGNPVSTLVSMRAQRRRTIYYTQNLTAYLNYNFKTGPLKHELVLGYDFINFSMSTNTYQNNARNFRKTDGTIGAYSAADGSSFQMQTLNGARLPVPNVPYFDLTNASVHPIGDATSYIFPNTNEIAPSGYATQGVYVMDQISWRNKLIFNFGLRQEFYMDMVNVRKPNQAIYYSQKLLKRFSLMYKPIDNVHLYGVYVEGYQPQTAARIGNPNAGGPFRPLTSNMFEFGAKTQWLNNRLKASVAYFNIHQTNILVGANDPNNPDLLIARGAQRNQGVEVEITGAILPEWQANIVYSYIDARYLDGGIYGSGYDLTQIEVVPKGARAVNTPANSFTFWSRYDFYKTRVPVLKNIGVGTNVNYVGDRLAWGDRNLQVPAYTIWDLALYYRTHGFQLACKFNNVLNATYWVGAYNYQRLFPGMPRNFMFNITYNF